jgi:RNA ligase (TIGR02306 family)
MERKLVTIRKVLDIKPILNADNIELAVIGGWQCIIKKGEFKVNDLGLFFEIDSFLPEIEQFEFLRRGSTFKTMETEEGLKSGFRLKSIKLRGQLSQGLLLPLSMFPDIDFSDTKKDYAHELGVLKYEPPISPQLQGIVKGNFPTHLFPKTSQERVQNINIDDLYEKQFIITEKLHGQSMTIYKNNEDFGVCSRNLDLKESDTNTLWVVANSLKLKEKLNKNVAIQGELCGEGINKNMYNIKVHKIFVFDIYDIDTQTYYSVPEMIEFCKELNLEHVPVLSNNNFNGLTMEQIIKTADGDSVIGKTIREGFVCKTPERDLSFKIISNNFLLKKGE